MEEENPGVVEEVKQETPIRERVELFIDDEGERIRRETDRVQSPIIAKARQEYKKRLAAFLEEEREKIRGEAERQADEIRSKAESEVKTIISQAQVEKLEIIASGKMEAQTRAEQIIEEAKQQANQAREEKVDKGQKEADAIIAEAKQRAEKLTSEADELALKNVEAEHAKILTEAQENATSQAATIVSDSWRRAQEMIDSAEVAYNLVRGQIREFGVTFAEAERRMALALKIPGGNREESESEHADLQPALEDRRV